MIQESTQKTTGNLHIRLVGPDGVVKAEFDHKNLVVQTGLNLIAQRMANNSTAVIGYMAAGSNNTTAASGNTTLGAELGRVATTVSSVVNNVTTWTATIGPGVATGNLYELGLFNAASAGSMAARTTFPLVQKGSSDTLYVNWALTFN